MKPCITMLAICFFFAVVPVFGQNVKLLTAETKITYSPTPASGDSIYNIYDSSNRIIAQHIWLLSNFGTWFLAYRNMDMEYNSNGNLLSMTFQERSSDGNWKDLIRTVNTYDSVGHQLSSFQEIRSDSTWTFNGSNEWTYDGNGNLLTWTIDNNILYNYSYNSDGSLHSKTWQTQSNGDWVDYSRDLFIYSPQSGTQPSVIRVQYWDGNYWFDFRKYTYTYDTNGDRISELLQKHASMNLVKESLRTFAYDSNHNIVFSRLEYWENDAWKNISQKFHAYDSDSDILMSKGEIWSNSSSNWVLYDIHRFHYTKLVSTYTPLFTDFHVYPNPANTFFMVEGEDLTHVQLFDSYGRLVGSQSLFEQGQETIQLGNLPTGNYILQVIGKNGKIGAKPLQITH